MEDILIYTDGACQNNQEKNNFGGWGAILLYKGKEKEIFGGFKNTTNNRMELKSVIESLKLLKRKDIAIKIFSDSSYVVNGMNEWLYNWIKKGKINKNADLWMELYKLSKDFDKIEFVKVKGHNGDKYNEIADKLAVKGAELNSETEDLENLNVEIKF